MPPDLRSVQLSKDPELVPDGLAFTHGGVNHCKFSDPSGPTTRAGNRLNDFWQSVSVCSSAPGPLQVASAAGRMELVRRGGKKLDD